MKFVAKVNYGYTIESGTMRPEVDANGTTRYVPATPLFNAEFRAQTLTHAEIESAKSQILMYGGKDAFGSIPGRDEGNINVQDASEEGYSTTAHGSYDVYQNLTTFDTADPSQCPPEMRAKCEEVLLNSNYIGLDYVRVDNYNLAPPWPTFPASGDTNVIEVVKFAKAGGLVNSALEYERATANRPDLVAALETALVEEQKKAKQAAALTATV